MDLFYCVYLRYKKCYEITHSKAKESSFDDILKKKAFSCDACTVCPLFDIFNRQIKPVSVFLKESLLSKSPQGQTCPYLKKHLITIC